MKKTKRNFYSIGVIVATIVIIASIFFSMFFTIRACRDDRRFADNPIVTTNLWVYRRISRNNIILLSVRDVTTVTCEKGILTIPTRIDGLRVVQLGDLRVRDSLEFSSSSNKVSRIVIPSGIFVETTFWRNLIITDYVEFLADRPGANYKLGNDFDRRRISLIVPDGRRERFVEYWRANIIEKSEHRTYRVWRYYNLNNYEISLVRLRNLSAAIDGDNTLTIPTHLDGRRVTRLGSTDLIGAEQAFSPDRGERIDRLIVPAGIYIERTFFRDFELTRRVEFLSHNPAYLVGGIQVGMNGLTVIVPTGSSEKYFEHFNRASWVTIVEREDESNE